jgi:hypothetical protein
MHGDNRDVEHEELLDLARHAEIASRSHDHETLLTTAQCLLTTLGTRA